MSTARLGFLASYRGTNMQAIIDACNSGSLPALPVVVISNNGKSMALDRAARENIPAYHLSSTTYTDADVLDRTITETLQQQEVDLVILAGYMKKIGPRLIQAYAGRILNVHPALLPRHGGKGMYGIHVHEAVLADGDAETGATIHLVDEEYDQGPILAQRRIPVQAGDTPESLASRVLEIEHELYVETIGRILKGEIPLKNFPNPQVT